MTLASKIAAASKEVGGKLSADKRNKEQGYDYLSADKILTVCGQALAEQGITIMPAIMDLAADAVTYMGKGGERSRYDARVHFLMKLTDGEEAQDLMWFGLGSDYTTPDKAVYKAITSGHKYFLMKLLNVGAGNEDGENETHEEGRVVARQPAQRTQPQPTTNGDKPWNDERKRKAVGWAMNTYPGTFHAKAHAENALNKLLRDHPDATSEDWAIEVRLRFKEAQAAAQAQPEPVDEEPLFEDGLYGTDQA